MGIVLDELLPVLSPLVPVARRLAAAALHLGRVLALRRRPARRREPATSTKTISPLCCVRNYADTCMDARIGCTYRCIGL